MTDRLILGRISDIGVPGRVARAVWLKGDRIHAVGGEDVAAAAIRDGALVEDFGERYVSPGFVDPHAHVEIGAVALRGYVDLRVPRVRCVDDVLQTLADHADGSSDWILGQANLFWDSKLADGRYPTREELDRVSRRQPIAVRAGGHYSVLNSRALEVSGIADYTRSEGMMGRALVHLDATGEPTGLVGEVDALLPLPQPEGAELRSALKAGMEALFTRYGVTAIGEISETRQGADAMFALAAEGSLAARIGLYLWVPGAFSVEGAREFQERRRSDATGMVTVKGLKIFADGGFSSRNAATLTPYRPRYAHSLGASGKLNLHTERIRDHLLDATEMDLQLAVHTNGERAQREAAAAVLGAMRMDARARGRTRLEHAGNYVTSQETVSSWLEAEIAISPQPAFLYNFADFIPQLLGRVGERGRHPFKSLLAGGIRVGGSSDLHMGSEVEQTNPLFGVWCSVKRESFLGKVLEPDEAVTLDEALRMHTLDAAALLGMESTVGSLEVGKLADVVVLEEDPHDVTVDQLREIRTDLVVVGGRTVHRRPDARAPLPHRSTELVG
jgi:predicted amidohydrolase YtcJ